MASFLESLQNQTGGGGYGLNTLLPQQSAAPAIDYNTVRNPYGAWQSDYAKNNTSNPYTANSQITQTKDQFLQKYANAIGPDGKFKPGGANLWYDGEDAASVYDTLIGRQAGQTRHMGNFRDGYDVTDPDTFNSEVNMDWINDPRAGGGLDAISSMLGTDSSQSGIGKIGKELTSNPIVNSALVAAGSVLGGPAGAGGVNALISRAQGNEWDQVASNAAGAALGSWGVGQIAPGLSGGGVDGFLETFGAGGVPSAGTAGTAAPSLTGGAVGAGDLALTAMPEVTAASMGMTGAQAAGLGSLAIPQLGASDLALNAMPEITSNMVGSSALPDLVALSNTAVPSLTGGAVGAGDLATMAMPEVSAGSLGMAEAGLGGAAGAATLGNTAANAATAATGETLTNGALGGMSTAIEGGIGSGVANAANAATIGGASNFWGSPAGQLLNGLGSSTGAGAIGSLISANNSGNTSANNQNAITNQMNTLANMYSQDSPYAKMLKQQLERKDAAAGRNSQYGNRLTQLQAMLADKAAGVASTVGNLSLQSNQINNAQTANQNTQLNALGQLANATGVTDWTKSWLNNGLSSLFGGG